ncbi:MAG: HD domain-containing protein [Chloroflexota bacterium]
MKRAIYRVRQFLAALRAAPGAADLEQLREALSPPLLDLFCSMQAGEQAHSLQVYRRLRADGAANPHLLAAALLHDVGKTRSPLRLWQRAAVVLAQALIPARARRWGQGHPHGWKRPFVTAAQHPAWGAEQAAAAGAAPLVVALIRRHQDPPPASGPATEEDRLLLWLQRYDDES